MFEVGSCIKFKDSFDNWAIAKGWNPQYIYVVMQNEQGKSVIYKYNIYIPYAKHMDQFLFADIEFDPYIFIEWEEVV